MAEAFEYAVRKDVRNNPIVREVDADRQRELWGTLGIGALLVVTMLFWAWQHFELLRHGYRLEELQRQRAAEEDTARHLRLEIERLATSQLRMVAPAAEDALAIERVLPSPAPPSSALARK